MATAKKPTAKKPATKKRAITKQNSGAFLIGGSEVLSGATVSTNTAMGLPAVFCAIRVIAESVASLPLILYRRTDQGKERATDHALYRLVRHEPNQEMTSAELLETGMYWLLTSGNSYLAITRNQAGQVQELFPIASNRVSITRESELLAYYVDGKRVLPTDLVHFKILSQDGISGMSPITVCRQALGRQIAMDQAASALWKNQARPAGKLTFAGVLSDNAKTNLRRSFEGLYSGSENYGKVVVLEEGLEFQALSFGFSPEDAQYVESMNFNIDDVARVYNIPPIKLHSLGRATWNNSAELQLHFMQNCLHPYLVKIEQQLNRRLLTEAEKDTYFFEFMVDDFLRMDAKSRMQIATQGISWGIFSQNEVRTQLYNMNAIPGGDDYLRPMNMTPDTEVEESPEPEDSEDA